VGTRSQSEKVSGATTAEVKSEEKADAAGVVYVVVSLTGSQSLNDSGAMTG
jgi:hypothetical protein